MVVFWGMKMIYQDRLVSITEDTIVFEHYYFPTGKSKVVRLDEIEWIQVKKSTIMNGKWRIHGTGNFKIWFPQDFGRPKRDRIFFAGLTNQWVQIGFTAEDGERVEKIFRSMGFVKEK